VSQQAFGSSQDDAPLAPATVAILAVSLVRARDLLARSVAEEQAANELSRFFAPEVAAHFLRRKQTEKRQLLIFRSDLKL
jgi:adenylate cyclase